jgi:hypothetical protein
MSGVFHKAEVKGQVTGTALPLQRAHSDRLPVVDGHTARDTNQQ